jgi:dihydrofolate reductase
LKKIIIVAVAQNGVIGKSNGEISWHVKEEFQHFKNTTMGFPMIMGRKTFNSLGKPLKGRPHLVVSRNKNLSISFEEVKIFLSIDEAIKGAEEYNKEKVFIIGGGEIYSQSINIVDEMLISFMKFEAEGDVYFPKIDNTIWQEESREKRDEFEIVKFVRK